MRSLASTGRAIERLAAHTQAGISDEDRRHLEAWQARVVERWHDGPPPTLEQIALLVLIGMQ